MMCRVIVDVELLLRYGDFRFITKNPRSKGTRWHSYRTSFTDSFFPHFRLLESAALRAASRTLMNKNNSQILRNLLVSALFRYGEVTISINTPALCTVL